MAEEQVSNQDTDETDEVEVKVSPLDLILGKSVEELQPWEVCTLPSKGAYYDGRIPGGAVEVKPLNIHAEKILTTQRLVRTGEAIEHVFKNHVRLPSGYDSMDLLEGDREFILYYLRGITHGNEYEFMLTCPQCSHTSDQLYDLNDLWETARFPDPDIGLEPFNVVLPHFTKTLQDEGVDEEFSVNIRFLRGSDTMDLLGVSNPLNAQKRARSKKRRNRAEAVAADIKDRGENLDETLERNINTIIVDIMGEKSRNKIKKLVERMHSKDVSIILDFLNEYTPGIDNSIETECGNPKCDATLTVPLPITEEFFRPKNSKRARE